MSTDRREFLHRLALSGVAFSALPASMHADEPRSQGASSATMYDEWLAMQQPPAAPAYDTSWPSKLTGKFKTVFDVPEITSGGGVWRAAMWSNHLRDVLKVDATDISSVIVIRHAGIPLAMNHEFWDTYDVAKKNKVTHPMTDKKTRRNPVLMTVEDDQMPANFAAMTLNKQIERGSIVLACNTAFSGMVSLVAQKDKLKFPEARAKALTMLVPGVMLQPNGIFGVALAQHHGCAFVAAS